MEVDQRRILVRAFLSAQCKAEQRLKRYGSSQDRAAKIRIHPVEQRVQSNAAAALAHNDVADTSVIALKKSAPEHLAGKRNIHGRAGDSLLPRDAAASVARSGKQPSLRFHAATRSMHSSSYASMTTEISFADTCSKLPKMSGS